jgi:outer membrane protein OmpA-like peptidoglycan-associated protein
MKPLSLLAAAAVVLAAGCATNPAPSQALEQARAAVGAAQADPHVPSLAPGELDLATRTLNDAERLAREGAPTEYISHRAYVAEQRARIARETAMARATEAEADQARQQRRARLEERAREAEAARERAEAVAREQQQKLQAIEQARQAEQSKRLASSEELGAEVRRLASQVPELRVTEGDRGWMLSLQNELLFEPGDATLRNGGRRAIDNLARVLRQHPERNVLIEGYSNEASGEESNRRLSERRAQTVRNALVLAGVDAERLVARGAESRTMGDARTGVQIVIAREPGLAAAGGSR